MLIIHYIMTEFLFSGEIYQKKKSKMLSIALISKEKVIFMFFQNWYFDLQVRVVKLNVLQL